MLSYIMCYNLLQFLEIIKLCRLNIIEHLNLFDMLILLMPLLYFPNINYNCPYIFGMNAIENRINYMLKSVVDSNLLSQFFIPSILFCIYSDKHKHSFIWFLHYLLWSITNPWYIWQFVRAVLYLAWVSLLLNDQ